MGSSPSLSNASKQIQSFKKLSDSKGDLKRAKRDFAKNV
jgi:hypothetical protein